MDGNELDRIPVSPYPGFMLGYLGGRSVVFEGDQAEDKTIAMPQAED